LSVAPESADAFEGRQESILNRILCILHITELAKNHPV